MFAQDANQQSCSTLNYSSYQCVESHSLMIAIKAPTLPLESGIISPTFRKSKGPRVFS